MNGVSMSLVREIFVAAMWPKPRFPEHSSNSMCNVVIYLYAKSASEAAVSLISNESGTRGRQRGARMSKWLLEAGQEMVGKLIDDLLAADPAGTVQIDMYAPRGRKRAGLRTKQGRLLRIRLGKTVHYIDNVIYNGRAFEVTRDAVTVRCHCQTTQAISRIRTMNVWPSPA